MLPVLVPQQNDSDHRSFANEREILYQVLFDMKKDITDLKQVVKNLMEGTGANTSAYDKDTAAIHSSLIRHAESDVPLPIKLDTMSQKINLEEHDRGDIQEATEYEESALSISEVEKEMIVKALERHQGKRKMAAADLGISERTLYRKIKEYKLEG